VYGIGLCVRYSGREPTVAHWFPQLFYFEKIGGPHGTDGRTDKWIDGRTGYNPYWEGRIIDKQIQTH